MRKAKGIVVLLLTLRMVLLITIKRIVAFDDDIKTIRSSSSSSSSSTVRAMFVLGDSSVDCGDNTLLYPFFHGNFSVLPCPSFYDRHSTTLLPQLLAVKMGLPYIPPFYTQNGELEGILNGINFGSALATIMSPSNPSHQSLNQQLRQSFDTLQLLQLLLGQENADHFIKSSLFYLSFGTNDYINHFLSTSNTNRGYNSETFASMLVDQMVNAIKDLHNANVRRIVFMGILPLGCAPRMLWERFSSTGYRNTGGCVDEINAMVLEYNAMLEKGIFQLNAELPDAQIVFCDVYRAIMEIIINPNAYGFEDIMSACCGEGRYGAEIGCFSMNMACPQASTHVWWDLYNPTPAVNSVVADMAWSGQPLPDICHPISLQKLASSPV